jgi:NAD(P)-dependent dehydrogenase (short-subunit alcohol dehydrogenase family)
VYSVDLRDVAGVERFCDYLKATLPGLDIIVNNACQTVRRPASYYAHLLPLERSVGAAMRSGASVEVGEHSSLVPLLSADASRRASEGQSESSAPTPTSLPTSIDTLEMDEYYPSAAELSQLKIAPEDHAVSPADLPPGHLDVNGQQIDLRTTNSWLLKLQDVSVPELVEVMAINALAPFLLNSRLQPLMASTPGHVFVVNVSAMEGKFYRHKTANHPHTNMAKAALNMMTRTSAKDLAEKDGIYMTAVDTGWINDENPRDKAARIAESAHFQTPIDEVDAAARVLHPVFHGVSTKEPLYGVFLKDFIATEW